MKAQARPARSGCPFNSRFVNVAKAAGLKQPTIYGGIDAKKYILEANGCGCAFLGYDNDGWLDIFLLCGTRLDGDPPEATNRLYKNNAMARSPMQHKGRVCIARVGQMGYVSVITTTTASNTFSLPISVKIMEMEHSQTSQRQHG